MSTLNSDQTKKNSVYEEIQKIFVVWNPWYKILNNFNLKNNLIKPHETISVDNDTIEHRGQIVQMKPLFQTSIRSSTTTEYCSQHLSNIGIDKCHRCKKHMCFDCRQQLTLGPSIINYCEKCIDDVSCTIQ
ncbi:unnamed protein product [Adineta steineri]|uniref:Uncharacterized protein n=1 Tax=Adineta steineri TaxID=433720 RepID=A0A815R541_9BILA|nr:unnamed protein product [Adineta steineri]CAF1470656.1 unnamed protein product [Adineta steineri]CAF3633834.1 unnamed protein product [Adineta steineri]CAF4013908.1 unnamed protein product [Adineta steineri]CAF4229680.1 unnamed protein product [Adineta steineri]